MSESQFKEEVARRLASELKKIQEESRKSSSAGAPGAQSARPAPEEPPPKAPALKEVSQETAPQPTPSPPPRAEPTAAPTAVPTPVAETRVAPPETLGEAETPAKILRVVKPNYPQLALRARMRGIVLLRVLVSETGTPEQIEVLKGVGGGLTEAAISAVRRWTFEPARRNGQAVKSWTTVAIPFEP
jgi:protein TonB